MENQRATTSPAELSGIFARYWDDRSATFDAEPQHVSQSDEETAAWKDALGAFAPGPSELSILDVGTGTGFLVFLLTEMGHLVTGIDISTGMLAQAREKAARLGTAVMFQRADAVHTGFPDEAFDLVVSRHLFWNLPYPEAALEEWIRVTKRGGVVALFDGTFDVKGDRWGPEYRAAFEALPSARGRLPENVLTLMAQQGLEQLEVNWLNDLMEIKRRALPEDLAKHYSDNRYYLAAGTKPFSK